MLSPADMPFSSGWSEMPCRAARKPSLSSGRAAILRTPASSQEANGSPPSSRWQFSFKSKRQKAFLQSEEGVCSAPRQRQTHSLTLNMQKIPTKEGQEPYRCRTPRIDQTFNHLSVSQKVKQSLLLCCHRNHSACNLTEKWTATNSLSFHSH